MNQWKSFNSLFILTLVFLNSVTGRADQFLGAQPTPMGKADTVTQLQIQFPEKMLKGEAFRVTCTPTIEGSESWGMNDTIWTYNFKSERSWETPKLKGGSTCQVEQINELKSANGKVWKAGTIRYSVVASGPNVKRLIVPSAFQDSIREKEPVMMIIFDGDIDQAQFFSRKSAYLSYSSGNAPAEKMYLTAVPEKEQKDLFEYFQKNEWVDGVKFEGKNWIFVTSNRNLIPGSEVTLNISGVVSGYNSKIISAQVYSNKLNVRRNFQAKVECTSVTAGGDICLPRAPVYVRFNSKVKWAEAKSTYIEYIPYGSKDRKVVRAEPTLEDDQQESSWIDSAIDAIADYLPGVGRFSDTLVESLIFNVDVEAETSAKVVINQQLKDIDGRTLSNSLAEYRLRFGAMREMIDGPQGYAIFEKALGPKISLPVSIINLHQKVVIRKTGTKAEQWEPLSDVTQIVRVLRTYSALGEHRYQKLYTSPLEQLGVASTKIETTLTGPKNRATYLQLPFSSAGAPPRSGLYVVEVSSPSYEKSNSFDDTYINPRHTLAQVTDLAIHIKRGQKQSVVWVTQLSSGQPVANAQVEIYNCLGQKVTTVAANASGLAYVQNAKWADNCELQNDGMGYDTYSRPEEFFVVARTTNDFAMTHTTWLSPSSYIWGAEGVEYFYSSIAEGKPFFHAIIGTNLVKPGQKVPVQIFAAQTELTGFGQVQKQHLPVKARLIEVNDPENFYEFNLKWQGSSSSFVFHVPTTNAVKLGRYYLSLITKDNQKTELMSADIEVAEFKVPLMSGVVSLPNRHLMRPTTVPVNGTVRYANGVGAKDLAVELSYYFEPAYLNFQHYTEFTFGTGPALVVDKENPVKDMPDYQRPETIENLKTNKDGSVTVDLATQKLRDGRNLSEIFKELSNPQQLVTRLRYQDQMGEYQTLSASKIVYNAPYYVGLKLVSGEASKARIQSVVVNTAGRAIATRRVEHKLYAVVTKVIGEELYGGLIKNIIERELKEVKYAPQCGSEKGVISCPFGRLNAGTYAIQVQEKSFSQSAHLIFKVDKNGSVYPEYYYHFYGDSDEQKRFPLTLNKPEYKGGERVVVSYPAPFKKCQALVTVERSDVIEAFVAPQACEAGQIQVTADSKLAPNAFVSVLAVSGRMSAAAQVNPGDLDLSRPTYRLGFGNIKIDWNNYRANVNVLLNSEKFAPGETVIADVIVDTNGRHTPTGKVTLIAIEEKLLALKENKSYQLLDALMQMRSHSVSTITSLEQLKTVAIDDGKLNDGAANAPGAGREARKGGEEGGGGGTDLTRKLFDSLVTFQPGVQLVNGRARVQFKVNDSLTKFKVFAVAATDTMHFGTGEATYLTAKDVQSFANTATVGYTGDKLPLVANVQNNSGQAQNFKVEFEVTMKDSKGQVVERKKYSETKSIAKSSAGSVVVGELIVPEHISTVSYKITVIDGQGQVVDQLEPEEQTILSTTPLAVHHSYIYQVEKGALDVVVNKGANEVLQKGSVSVTVSNSIVQSSLDSMSRRLKNDPFSDFLLESRIYKALIQSTPENSKALQAVLAEVAAQLDSQGFIKYHSGAYAGSPWLTADVLSALRTEPWAIELLSASAATKLQSAVINSLNQNLPENYMSDNQMSWLRLRLRMAIAAYAFQVEELRELANQTYESIVSDLQADPAAFGLPIEKWELSTRVDLWRLEALVNPQTALTSAHLKYVLDPARMVIAGNARTLAGQPNFWYNLIYNDETLLTAQVLTSLSELKGDVQLAQSFAVGLVSSSAKAWYTNSTLVNTAQALRQFQRNYESEPVAGSTQVQIVEMDKYETVNVTVSPQTVETNWNTARATVKLAHRGSGSPWVAVQGLTANNSTKPLSQGITIDKQIRNLNRPEGYQPGDMVEVTLNIHTAAPLTHVALIDPIPAGSNILAEAYGYFTSGEKSYRGYRLYFENLNHGLNVVKYQYQLNSPGEFNMPPTRAEGVYMPSVFGEAPNARLVVR